MEQELSGSQILKDLQGQSSCLDFGQMECLNQRAVCVEVAERVGFAPDHASMDFDGRHPSEKAIMNVAYANPLEKPNSLLLFGKVGCGKTAILSAMLKWRFYTWAEATTCKAYLLPAIFCHNVMYLTHGEYNNLLHEHSDLIDPEQVQKCKLLILDEFMSGHDDKTGYHMARMEELIDYRWRYGLDTWIAMNLDPAEIKNQQSFKKIFSRLTDENWIKVFRWSGKDRRSGAK